MSELVPTDAIETQAEPGPSGKKKNGRPRLLAIRAEIIKVKLLQGVSEHYCRHFSRSEWGVTPACARRYVHFAKKLIGIDSKPYTQDVFLDHLALMRHLRAKAFEMHDLKLVLEIAKNEEELLNLYDVKKPKHVSSHSSDSSSQSQSVIGVVGADPSILIAGPAVPDDGAK